MADQILGTKPSISNDPYATISPAQQQLQSVLAGLTKQNLPNYISNINSGQAAIPYGGQYAAPLTADTNSLIQQIMGTVSPGGASSNILGNAQNALTKILGGQPQDFSSYFQNSVAAPEERVFNEQTLPALKAAFARSAGGTNSVGGNTGYSAAVGQATEGLDQNLNSAMTSLATQAVTQANNNMVSGVGMAPGLSSQFLQNYLGAIAPSTLPQQVQQQQLSGQYGQYANSLNFLSSFFGQGAGLASSPTMNMNTVVNPGSPGYLSYLISGLGQGLGAMMAK